VVDSNGAKKLPFDTELFEYEKSAAPLKKKIPSSIGFAGFRLHYPINKPEYRDEVIVFLGASYFRAVAQSSNYGLSARACALNTFSSVPEEFPYFKEFWLVKPMPYDQTITIYGLLEGPSITGAYQFTVQPDSETVVDVKSTIFMRTNVEKLGIAPLTSMFFYGENTNCRPVDDFRPEVHDSDGVQICTESGEWIWRPLKNGRALLDNWYSLVNPRGFGLIQRDHDFDHYQDLEARYDLRPSVWISPKGDWGEGAVEIIQMSSTREIDDNINVLWVPAQQPEPKQPRSYDYTMSWHFPGPSRPPAGRVVATRTGIGGSIVHGGDPLTRKFVVDFEGEKLASLPPDKKLTAVVSVDSRVKLLEQQLHKNEMTNGWRLVFQVGVDSEELFQKVATGREPAIELRAFIKDGEEVLTETWTYAIQP
ncbi:MAG TPA: glucan biosynthesis protein, partial [Thermodesulfobacteriota bacterium]|nr:glucan biosynthesis protein [Thermodesulfobacteriota bacterium]